MRDVLPDIQKWDAQIPVCVATVVQTWGSAPRQIGAKLAFTPDYKLSGSVSGGCIEPAVIEAGLEVLRTNVPRLLHFGVADETAFEQVGLACGGSIEVFVEPLTQAARAFWDETAKDDLAAVSVTMLDGPAIGAKVMAREGAAAQVFAGADFAVIPALKALAEENLAQPHARAGRHAVPGAGNALVEVFSPLPTLILVGGAHIAVALAPMAKQLGYRVVVLDPREAFGNRERFPSADEVINGWPDKTLARMPITRGTAIVALTHNETLDDPALKIALRSKAFYVGALGGKTTREKRLSRLRAAGFAEAELARLRQPIGLDIGASNPEEIALATLAQIVAERRKPA
jgi:xanthine dehydrogenase accessory factor